MKDIDGLYTFKINVDIQKSYSNQDQDSKPQSVTSIHLQIPNQDFKDSMFFAPRKSMKTTKISNIDVSKTNDHIQVRIKFPNPVRKPLHPPRPQSGLHNMDFFAKSKCKKLKL